MIAIYPRDGSFSDRWIEVCKSRGVSYTCVDMFSDDICQTLRAQTCTAFLCHPPMYDRRSTISARSIIHACQESGITVFPGIEDYWHFDDKIAQKYVFDAFGVPTPDTHVFLNREDAIKWVSRASFPVVFKLKSGAGSINVSLLKNEQQAVARINRMFASGYPATDAAVKDIRTKIRMHRSRRNWPETMRRMPTTIREWWRLRKAIEWERGYAYLQEFVPENKSDTRVTVIGERAFAFRRMVRVNDFRASGSGDINYDPAAIDPACVRMAFQIAKNLRTKCIAFDFVHAPEGKEPLVVEMSFAFMARAVFDCPGHWREGMEWQSGHMWPQDAILDDVLSAVGER